MSGVEAEKKESLVRPGERLDDLERDGLVLIQDPGGFCYGVDAVLLSWFAAASAGERVADLCTGSGVVPILMSAKTQAESFAALEIMEDVADRAKRSVLLNGLEKKISIVQGDVKEASAILGRGAFEVVTVNPPYVEGGSGLVTKSYGKAVARHEILCRLEDIIREGARLLAAGGRFYMVHRPARLSSIIRLMGEYRMSPRRLRMVHPRADADAVLVLIEAVRGGNTQIKAEPPVILYDDGGKESRQIRIIHGKEPSDTV